jgi:heptosyltransferase-2
MIDFKEVKFDCFHFKGAIPCKPNKLHGVDCVNCSHYVPISKRILIIKLGALGDVIRSTPLLEKLRENYANAHITWLTLSPTILPQDKIDEILSLNFINLYNLENSNFDIAINLDKDKEACILLSKINAIEKHGYSWENDHIAPATEAAKHKLNTGFFDHISKANSKNYIQEIFEICGFNFKGEEYQINLNHTLVEKWKDYFASIANGKKIVGLNTGCGPRWNTRLWKDEKWIETAQGLKQCGYFPVFLGGELEHDKNLKLSEKSGALYPGHFSLPEFIALTNSCDLVVTQVTMMMHIATALRKKMVLINTIFNPNEFEMYGRGVIIGPERGCDCYFGNTCVHVEPCMQTISPTTIVDAVQKLSCL